MKKTLIALALAATAVSGSAMAWVPNSIGGTMEFGGTLTPQNVQNPWEVQVGPNINVLNSSIKPGGNNVDITLSQSVPLLGIRTVTANEFFGSPGISPQIDYKGAVGVDSFNAGEASLSLKVFKAEDASVELGVLSAKLSAAGISSSSTNSNRSSLYADVAGKGFFGGLPKAAGDAVSTEDAARLMLRDLSSDYIARYSSSSSLASVAPVSTYFATTTTKYSAAYGAGLKNGSKVTITMLKPVTENTNWKATFPVTVSYP